MYRLGVIYIIYICLCVWCVCKCVIMCGYQCVTMCGYPYVGTHICDERSIWLNIQWLLVSCYCSQSSWFCIQVFLPHSKAARTRLSILRKLLFAIVMVLYTSYSSLLFTSYSSLLFTSYSSLLFTSYSSMQAHREHPTYKWYVSAEAAHIYIYI